MVEGPRRAGQLRRMEAQATQKASWGIIPCPIAAGEFPLGICVLCSVLNSTWVPSPLRLLQEIPSPFLPFSLAPPPPPKTVAFQVI